MMYILYALMLVLMCYIVSGICMYLYAVVLNKQFIDEYIWKMNETHIGICEYPQWLMGWMYWTVKRFNKGM